MGTNLVKHAKEGEIFLRTLAHGSMQGIEIVALDRGPGMANVGHALQDGHSTAGSSGTGLGAIVRMATEFDIHSLPGRGTVPRGSYLEWGGPSAGNAQASSDRCDQSGPYQGRACPGMLGMPRRRGDDSMCGGGRARPWPPGGAGCRSCGWELGEHHDASLSDQIGFAHGALRRPEAPR